jgi:hypothetical protein
MQFDLFPYRKPFNLLIGLSIQRPVTIRLTVFDSITKRVFAFRRLKLGKSLDFLVKMPIVPDQLTAQIVAENQQNSKEPFTIEQIKVMPDTKCPVELTEKDRQFISFAKWFAVELNNLEAGEKGTIYQSEGFSILYLDQIKEGETELTTPARVERMSGMIEVSKKAVKNYTVPMLMIMLLHEYGHKWKNPEFGKEVANELTADIIAVHIALNLGFDFTEVENCYRAVFAQKDTELNRRRMKAILEFIELFRSNEKERCNTRNHASRPK